MKTWSKVDFIELGIEETAHGWTGIYKDGGYIGDGTISGHLTWDKPAATAAPTAAPTNAPSPENSLS